MSEKINDKIKELMEKENLDPAEMEAEIQKINEAILDVWADSSKHVKTLASLPPEVFDLVIENMANIRKCLNENDTDRPGFADEIPQDVVIGHMVIEGINSLFEKHARREMRKLMEAMAAAGAERVQPGEEQLEAMEQFIRSKFGPDAQIERTEDGFNVAVPAENSPDIKEVMEGLKDVIVDGEVSVEKKIEGEDQGETVSLVSEDCNGDCENCAKNPFKELMQQDAAQDNGDIIVADDDHGVMILSNESPAESLN